MLVDMKLHGRIGAVRSGFLLHVLLSLVGCSSPPGAEQVDSPPNPAPTLVAWWPAAESVGVGLDTAVAAAFGAAMDPATLGTETVTLRTATEEVAATVTYADRRVLLRPVAPLARDTIFTATVSTGVRDSLGHALDRPFSWTFTTGRAPCAQDPVALGEAARYAVLARAAVASAGTTTLTGSVGVGVDGTIDGFPGAAVYTTPSFRRAL
jgi:hypothetical protein